MAIPPFTAGTPSDGQKLGNSKVPIRNNLDALAQTIAVDHVALGLGGQGKHTVIHLPSAQASDPTTAAGEIALYQKLVGGVNDLFLRYESNGTVIRMTGNYNPAQNGYWFIPGGLLLQWGVNALPGTGTVTFPIAFSGLIVYNVQATPIAPALGTISEHVVAPKLNTATNTQFEYNWNGTTSYPFFYWFAIGPS